VELMSATQQTENGKAGLIFDVKRYSVHDGPGIRTTIFLKGCPLDCPWCQNPESRDDSPNLLFREEKCIVCGSCLDECPTGAISPDKGDLIPDSEKCIRCATCTEICPTGAREMVGRIMSVEEVVAEVEKDLLFYDESGGGVTFSGGEPLAQPAFLIGLLKACGQREIHRTVDTTGLTDPDTLIQVAENTDLFLYDLKLMNPERHLQFTGVRNERIISNLEILTLLGVEIIIRYPVIPSVNDDLENARLTAEFVSSLKGVPDVNILPFHKAARDKHERFGLDYRIDEAAEASDEQLSRICAVMEEKGLKVKIGG
jgi:pyruvate formate lyase activating enzyme